MMNELLIWLSTHPDVEVRFNQDSIFHTLKIRVIKGRYISEHMMDETECDIFLKNGEVGTIDPPYTKAYKNYNVTKLIISIISHLYDEIESEEAKGAK